MYPVAYEEFICLRMSPPKSLMVYGETKGKCFALTPKFTHVILLFTRHI